MPRTLVPILLLLLAAVTALSASGKSGGAPYTTDQHLWRAAEGGFSSWSRSGVSLASDGALQIDLATAAGETDPYPALGYQGRNYYNGGSYLIGEAVSPEIPAAPFTEAIPSWNAETPAGSWVEMQIRAHVGDHWTKWYTAGPWASGTGTVERHSVNLQADGVDGTFAVDTLILNGKKAPPADAYQVKLRLFSTGGGIPEVRFASVALSGAAPTRPTLQAGDPASWGTLVDLPEFSQMVYPDGGNVWCSPTSLAMVLAGVGYAQPPEPRVRQTVEGVFDWRYDGHGNWSFNTAWAAHEGMEAQVARFTSFRDVERWVKAGVPVVFSFAWRKGDLTGSAIPSSDGHLAVIVGFDAAGNPIVNDPASATNADVRRTYDRVELETLWLEASGGTVYLVYPRGKATPPLGS